LGAAMAYCIDEALIRSGQEVVDALRRRKSSLVTAESCTGGLIAAILSQCKDASDCLHGGFVTYTKIQKSLALGIPATALESCGSVSVEVARLMVRGALERSVAQMALSVTGVLGPQTDEDGTAPGTVFVAILSRALGTATVHSRQYEGHPEEIRRSLILDALKLLRQSSG